MGTTLLILCLPLNHKHNIVPPKLPAQCQTDSLNPAHKNSPLGVRQIRIILLHPNLIHRTQCLTPEPMTQSPARHQNPKPNPNTPTQTPQPKTPYQSLNYSRPALKTKNPATEIAGFFLRENLLRFLTKPTENQQTSDTRQ